MANKLLQINNSEENLSCIVRFMNIEHFRTEVYNVTSRSQQAEYHFLKCRRFHLGLSGNSKNTKRFDTKICRTKWLILIGPKTND